MVSEDGQSPMRQPFDSGRSIMFEGRRRPFTVLEESEDDVFQLSANLPKIVPVPLKAVASAASPVCVPSSLGFLQFLKPQLKVEGQGNGSYPAQVKSKLPIIFAEEPAAAVLDTDIDDGGITSDFDVEVSDDEVDRSFHAAMRKFQRMLDRVKGPPLLVKNDFDRRLPPSDFVFIEETMHGEGVPRPDDSFLFGCQCEGLDGSCCSLARAASGTEDEEEEEEAWEKTRGRRRPAKDASSRWKKPSMCDCLRLHQQHHHEQPQGKRRQGQPLGPYDEFGRIRPETQVIWECNRRCACVQSGLACANRVIHAGRKVSLTIFRLPDARGWGLQANHDIPAGTFIDCYLGEMITVEEASRRTSSYLFDLDYNYEPSQECAYVLDALRYGNCTHFINHSCEPSLRVVPCFLDNLDPSLHSIAFFAARDIARGEELTFDYMGSAASRGGADDGATSASSSVDALGMACLCGAATCRKAIFK